VLQWLRTQPRTRPAPGIALALWTVCQDGLQRSEVDASLCIGWAAGIGMRVVVCRGGAGAACWGGRTVTAAAAPSVRVNGVVQLVSYIRGGQVRDESPRGALSPHRGSRRATGDPLTTS